MAITVRLSTSSQVDTTLTLNTPAREDILEFARVIYQHLGSLTDNKVLVREDKETSYYSMIINLLDDYAKTIDDPSFQIKDTVIAQIDEYLGNLGGSEEYPFVEDYQWTPLWVDPNTKNYIREVWVFNEFNTLIDNVVVLNEETQEYDQIIRIAT